MTESGWRTLLHHLLSLRRTIFSFIDVVTCYKVSLRFKEGNMPSVIMTNSGLLGNR